NRLAALEAASVERIRVALRTWSAAGPVGDAVRPALESRYQKTHVAALRNVGSEALRTYSEVLASETRAARLRGARVEDLPLAVEQAAVNAVLEARDVRQPS